MLQCVSNQIPFGLHSNIWDQNNVTHSLQIFCREQTNYCITCSSHVTHADFQYKSKEEQKLIPCKTPNQKFDILDIFEFINPSSKEYVDPSTHWRSAQQDFQRATGFSASRQSIILSSDLTLNQTKRRCFGWFKICER